MQRLSLLICQAGKRCFGSSHFFSIETGTVRLGRAMSEVFVTQQRQKKKRLCNSYPAVQEAKRVLIKPAEPSISASKNSWFMSGEEVISCSIKYYSKTKSVPVQQQEAKLLFWSKMESLFLLDKSVTEEVGWSRQKEEEEFLNMLKNGIIEHYESLLRGKPHFFLLLLKKRRRSREIDCSFVILLQWKQFVK